MTASELGLAASVFLASAVECVEALTIVVAMGHSRSWRSALGGAVAALIALAAVALAVGAGLTAIPIDALRLLVGVALLGFGAQWLRKAVLRAAGRKALRDERLAYRHELEEARAVARASGSWDAYAFAVSFKGVLLEGFEVVLIVVTFGAAHHRTGLAALAAILAATLVALAGLAVRGPLARVPENTMKYAVGVMLTSFGVFWGAEGAGLSWPGGEASLPVLAGAVALGSLVAVGVLSRRGARGRGAEQGLAASQRLGREGQAPSA